jgi:hypothetical protein
MGKRFDREKYLSIGFSGVKSTAAPGSRVAADAAPRGYPYVSSALPRRGDPRCTHKGRFTKIGKPIIENKSQEDHIEGKSNGRYRIV